MTSVTKSPFRLVRHEATNRHRHAMGATATIVIASIYAVGLWSTPVALFAVGAGAGYSLSGSV